MDEDEEVYLSNQSEESCFEYSFKSDSSNSDSNKYLNIGLSMERYEYLNI